MPWACYGLTLKDLIALGFEYIEACTMSKVLCHHLILTRHCYFHSLLSICCPGAGHGPSGEHAAEHPRGLLVDVKPAHEQVSGDLVRCALGDGQGLADRAGGGLVG